MSNTTQMTDVQRNEFHVQLTQERAYKISRLQELQSELGLLQENQTDPLDQATVVEENRKVMADITRLQKSLKEIKHALEHFDDFGYCETCGVEIGVNRLRINLSITLCIGCKTIEEEKQKQFAK